MINESTVSFARMMKAIADDNRIKMLKLLTEKDISVCEMKEILNISYSQTSRSLTILYNAGLLSRWHEGKCVVYIADRVGCSIYGQKIINLISDCLNDDVEINKLRRNLRNAIEEKVREKCK